MEDQCPHFNTLPWLFVHSIWVSKRSVRNSAGPTIRLGVKALDQGDQIGSLAVAIVPFNIRVGLNRVRLALAIRVDKLDAHKVTIRKRMSISDGQWVFQNRLDRPPNIDDLITSLEELGAVLRKMVGDTVLGRFIGLVDVHTLDRSPLGRGRGPHIFGCTANSMVENEDTRSASSIVL